MLRAWHAQEQGQGMVEYSLILPLVSVIAIALLVLLGSKVTALFSSSYTQISLVLS
ncbi:MAG: Flp family type IVb pilin [Chloroflexi bacterium]|nr:Flp family type IVb pilin [Chloroflexota bacterium]